MTMKKTKNEIHAEKIGKAVAKNMFNSMLEPENQGKSFTWERFAEIFQGICETQIHLGFKDGVKNLDKLKELAVIAYTEECNRLKADYELNNELPRKIEQ